MQCFSSSPFSCVARPECCANLDNAAIPEKVALVPLKGMNGGDSNHDKPLEQRVHDVFISLDIHRLSQQVAELQLLRAQMLVGAQDAS